MVERKKVTSALALIVRAALAVVFAWAGLVKILDPAAFQVAIERYQLVPVPVAHLVAAYLPWLELITAAALWAPPVHRGAELLLLGLAIIFLIAIVSAGIRGLDIECGCFGFANKSRDAFAVLLARDLLILAGVIGLLKYTPPPRR